MFCVVVVCVTWKTLNRNMYDLLLMVCCTESVMVLFLHIVCVFWGRVRHPTLHSFVSALETHPHDYNKSQSPSSQSPPSLCWIDSKFLACKHPHIWLHFSDADTCVCSVVYASARVCVRDRVCVCVWNVVMTALYGI